MATVEVIKPGLHTTIQDLGRSGYLEYGVSHSGFLDSVAAVNANLICRNHPYTPLLECTYEAPVLKFTSYCLVGVTGVDVQVKLNEEVQESLPVAIKPGDILKVRLQKGSRAYISISGGIKSRRILGSTSYHSVTKIGQKPLEKGDILILGHCPKSNSHCLIHPLDYDSDLIRVYPGPEFHLLDKRTKDTFFNQSFKIRSESNRMACVLEGKPVRIDAHQMISSPVLPGTIQLPPQGLPIILLNDCQTVGGYPRILVVSEESYLILVQKKPGEKIRFEVI